MNTTSPDNPESSPQSRYITPDISKRIADLSIAGETDQAIADQVGLARESVTRHRLNVLKLKKQGTRKVQLDKEVLSKPVINRADLDENEKKVYWIRYFKSTARYADIQNRFTVDDIEFFCDRWAEYHLQLEDTTPAEESAIELLITYEIRIRQNQRAFKEACEHEDLLKAKLGSRQDQELDLENEQDRFLFELIISNNRNKEAINKDLKDLADRYDKILESLNATRRQREERQKVGADTFLSLIRQFNDRDRRRLAGLYNERMKIATDTKMAEMKEPHQFLDGTTEPIIIDGADYKELKSNE